MLLQQSIGGYDILMYLIYFYVFLSFSSLSSLHNNCDIISCVACTQSDDVSNFVGPSAKIIERMVNQNTFDDVTQGITYIFTHLSTLSPSAELSACISIMYAL